MATAPPPACYRGEEGGTAAGAGAGIGGCVEGAVPSAPPSAAGGSGSEATPSGSSAGTCGSRSSGRLVVCGVVPRERSGPVSEVLAPMIGARNAAASAPTIKPSTRPGTNALANDGCGATTVRTPGAVSFLVSMRDSTRESGREEPIQRIALDQIRRGPSRSHRRRILCIHMPYSTIDRTNAALVAG